MRVFIIFSIWLFIGSDSFAQGLDTQRHFFENPEGFPVLEDAQRVMGQNYFGLDETLRTFGILMFRGEVPPIPFKFRTLLERKECLLVLTLPVLNPADDVIELSSRFKKPRT